MEWSGAEQQGVHTSWQWWCGLLEVVFRLVDEVFSTLGVSVLPKGVFAVGVSILEASFEHGVGEVR